MNKNEDYLPIFHFLQAKNCFLHFFSLSTDFSRSLSFNITVIWTKNKKVPCKDWFVSFYLEDHFLTAITFDVDELWKFTNKFWKHKYQENQFGLIRDTSKEYKTFNIVCQNEKNLKNDEKFKKKKINKSGGKNRKSLHNTLLKWHFSIFLKNEMYRMKRNSKTIWQPF